MRVSVTDNFLEVDAKFHEAARVVQAEIPVATRTAAEEIARRAQAIASSYSKTIEVGIREVSPENVNVVGSSGNTPLAYLEEFGKGDSGEWHHPVFGNPPDVTQHSRPYLRPARDEVEPVIPRQALEEIAVGLRAIGFEVFVD